MRLLYCVGSVGLTTPSTVPVNVTTDAVASIFLTQSTRPLVGVGSVILTAPAVASTNTVSSVESTVYGLSANTFVTTWCVTLLPFRAVRLTPDDAGSGFGSAVKAAPEIAGRAPVRFPAVRLVRFAPDKAGSGEPRRASGTVPLPSAEASSAGSAPVKSDEGIVVVVDGTAMPAPTTSFR